LWGRSRWFLRAIDDDDVLFPKVCVGTSTLSPVEWQISTANKWLANVTTCPISSVWSKSGLAINRKASLSIGSCSKPAELQALLRRAEASLFNPATLASNLTDEQIRSNYYQSLLSPHRLQGVIIVELQVPIVLPSRVTLIDIPGELLSDSA